MEVTVAHLSKHVGEDITLRGWLHNKRSSGKLHFLEVRDGTGVAQCVVFKGDVDDDTFRRADHLQLESSLEVSGTVKEHGKIKGTYEIGVKMICVIAETTREYPLNAKKLAGDVFSTDYLMDHRHLWLRAPRQAAILRVRHTIIDGVRDFFDSRGFTLVDAPIFTPNACEGTSNLFETDYHGEPAYLTQSGQLYMEAAAAAVGKAYCFGPTFRAEKSKTRRHLAEFWMVEPEVAFMDLDGDMKLAEDFLAHVVGRCLEQRKEELKVLERDTAKLERVQAPFPRITYAEAIAILQNNGHPEAEVGDDFGGDEETVISSQFDRPVIVHRYPMSLKAFYFKRAPENADLALNMDVLAPEGYGEIIGGGQREDDYDRLVASILAHKLPLSAFEWYLDLRRYGSFPHAGFGLGIERTVAWICGLQHVRETIPFPRMLNRLSPYILKLMRGAWVALALVSACTGDSSTGDSGVVDSGSDGTMPADAGIDMGTSNTCAGPCMAAGGTCVDGGCVIDCTMPSSCASVTCPSNVPCSVNCGMGSCANVDCTKASKCDIDCAGSASCGVKVACGGSSCAVVCSGMSSCGIVTSTAGTSAICCTGPSSCQGAISCSTGTCTLQCAGMASCSGGDYCTGFTCILDASTCPPSGL